MKHTVTILLSVALALTGCTPSAFFVKPKEWTPRSNIDSIVAMSRPFLQGRKIFLDPGHGGEDRANRGPGGDAIEADVNLRVGLALREFLSEAGAVVTMSRTKDTTVALGERPLLAVARGAEIFVSLHHNATGSVDYITNYCSTYYHAREGTPEYHPANHDIARYIQRDVSYAMRNASPPFSPTFDGTLSDYDIYPNSGFAVLRQNPLPAVLIEGSFFTHPPEERRLADAEFNRIEAWGIFLGLAKYFRAGVPQLSMLSDSVCTVPQPTIVLSLLPRGDVDTRTLQLFLDGSPADVDVSESSGLATIILHRDLIGGIHEVSGWVRNKAGNSSWPFKKRIIVMLPPAALTLTAEPSTLPTDSRAFARIQCSASDANGHPVADGSNIRFVDRNGSLDTVISTTHGSASLYINSITTRDSLVILAGSGTVTSSIRLPIQKRSEETYLTGMVRSRADSLPVSGADFALFADLNAPRPRSTWSTWDDGRYIRYESIPESVTIFVHRPGFLVRRLTLGHPTAFLELNFWMTPVAGSVLSGKTFLIDARYRKDEPGSLGINVAVASQFCSLLQTAGANATLIADSNLTEQARAELSAHYPKGMYIRIDAASPFTEVGAHIYWNIPNRLFAGNLVAGVCALTRLDSSGVEGSRERFYRDVAMGAITISIPSVSSGYYNDRPEIKTGSIAWGLFRGTLKADGFVTGSAGRFRVTQDGAPAVGVPVTLDGTFTQLSGSNGIVDFFGLYTPESTIAAANAAGMIITPVDQQP